MSTSLLCSFWQQSGVTPWINHSCEQSGELGWQVLAWALLLTCQLILDTQPHLLVASISFLSFVLFAHTVLSPGQTYFLYICTVHKRRVLLSCTFRVAPKTILVVCCPSIPGALCTECSAGGRDEMGHPVLAASPKGYVLGHNGKQPFLGLNTVTSAGSQPAAAPPKLFATFS